MQYVAILFVAIDAAYKLGDAKPYVQDLVIYGTFLITRLPQHFLITRLPPGPCTQDPTSKKS